MSVRRWIAAALALSVGLGALLWLRGARSESSARAFSLIDAKSGQRFTDQDLRGEPAALFFGFTHCPDVCPTALSVAGRWLKALGGHGDQLRFVFMTVDPERDTQQSMAQYLRAFDPRIVGLTGTRAEIDRVIEGYQVHAQKVPSPSGEGYAYDHTALILLYDASGRFSGTLDFEDPEDAALAKLRTLIEGAGSAP